MRARNLKPGFFSNPILNSLSPGHRLLFLGLGALCDRRGLVEDRPKKIKQTVCQGFEIDVNAALDDLANAVDDDGSTLIQRYVGANGVKVVKIVKFLKHNKPHYKEPENPNLMEPGASLGQAQGKPKASPRRAPGRPALNPESGILNPESGGEDARVRARPPRGFSKRDRTDDTPATPKQRAFASRLLAQHGLTVEMWLAKHDHDQLLDSHIDLIRAFYTGQADQPDPQQLRPILESLDFELNDGGPDHAARWIDTQRPEHQDALRARLARITGVPA